jgi:hypothetical protein
MRFSELAPLEHLLMGYACEDWYGLYEVLPHAEGPDADFANEGRKGLKDAMLRLLDLGLVEIASRAELLSDPGPAVPPSDANSMILSDTSWSPPMAGEPVAVFTATSLGDRLFERASGDA